MEVERVTVEDERLLIQLRFDAAVKVIKSLPPDGPFQPSNDMMLKFYSYYKQASVGPCNIQRPGFWDAVGKAKWDAWNSLGEMPKEEAMAGYVDEMKLILEGMPMTNEVEALLRVLGPFYELIEDKKKITDISDLSTGFSTTLNSVASKSVAKSIIRTMEINGTLETRPANLKSKEVREMSEEEAAAAEEEDVEEEVVMKEVRKGTSQPKKKGSVRRSKAPMLNGKVTNGVTHLTNGSHSRAFLNSEDSQDSSVCEPLLNGDHTDVTGPNQLASDSDSEVYCDSVDQLGQEENSERNYSLEDLDEEENHVPPPLNEPHAQQEIQEEVQGPPQPHRCGGEDRENDGTMSQRPTLDTQESFLVRRESGSTSSGLGSRSRMPTYSGDDGDGDRQSGAVTTSESLNELIVAALARLQEDMQSILERLHTLEALTASQSLQTRSMSSSPTYASPPASRRTPKPSWWPFDISPTSLAFAVIWPFVVQWLIRLFLQRRRRRIN